MQLLAVHTSYKLAIFKNHILAKTHTSLKFMSKVIYELINDVRHSGNSNLVPFIIPLVVVPIESTTSVTSNL